MKRYSEQEAIAFDHKDPLRSFRDRFFIGDEDLVYLDGNSLGRLPLASLGGVMNAAEVQWGSRLIRSWNEHWYTMSARIGDQIAKIAGATPGEIIVSDSTSVNLYKLAYSALRRDPGRKKIITDELNFPSDIYILQGLVKEFGPGYELVILRSEDGISIKTSQLEREIDESTALVSLSHVVFKSAFRYPMKDVTSLVHRKGALVLWDLSHSIGAVPGELNQANADLAVGCTYKYLNGGPGAPAFLYVRKDLQEELQSPIWGWFGQHEPFAFGLNYTPAPGIMRFLAGTPPVLSLTPLEKSLEIIAEAGMDRLREKSLAQTQYLLELVEAFLSEKGFRTGSPLNAVDRGSHITLQHPEAYRICKAMIDKGTGDRVLIPDFREPDNIRLGIAPLYTRFIDIYRTIIQIGQIIDEGLFMNFSKDKEQVT